MTTPTGRLAYGQAGVYDALDDRAVIAAVTGYRTGLVAPVAVAAESGLNIVVTGGWLAVADCGDRTSAVVGATSDEVVVASPGPPTGVREDLVWVDVDPDAGIWTMDIIPASAAAGRPGLALAYVTVPANATLASQMTIRPAAAGLDRRLVGYAEASETNVRSGNSWETVGSPISVRGICEPGRVYRVRFTTNSALCLTSQTYNPPGGRIGVGYSVGSGPPLAKAAIIGWVKTDFAQFASVEHVFRHPVTSPLAELNFEGKVWIVGVGTFRVCGVTNMGPPLVLTVEDLGT